MIRPVSPVYNIRDKHQCSRALLAFYRIMKTMKGKIQNIRETIESNILKEMETQAEEEKSSEEGELDLRRNVG